jgi:transcriptional regulator with XRE-family HTH domain
MTYIEIMDKLPWNKKMAALRAAMGLSQEEAADICGTTRKNLFLWEQAKTYPRLNSRRAIARAYGLPEEEIFGQA